jgi:hypothetical protein
MPLPCNTLLLPLPFHYAHRCSSRSPTAAERRRFDRETQRTLERYAREGRQAANPPFTVETYFHIIQDNNGNGTPEAHSNKCKE